jgi:hypothetical protein
MSWFNTVANSNLESSCLVTWRCFKKDQQICRGDIFRIENPTVWQIPMLSQIFLWEIWVDYVWNVCKKIVYCCLNIWPTLFSQPFKLNISSISHQQAVTGICHTTEIFQSKDAATVQLFKK